MQKIKRLFFDIETSPNEGTFWRPGNKVSIPYENIRKERQIICISYKWQGKKVQSLDWGINTQDDKNLLKQFIKITEEADETVAHNGDQFDIKWVRGRAAYHKIPMQPDILTVDTMKLAKRYLNLNSYRLDYLAQYFGVGGKISTGGLALWHGVMDKDRKAFDKMIRYCNNDVVILEKVFKAIQPYILPRTRVSPDRTRCAECNGIMIKQRERMLASGAQKVVLRCEKCGKYNTVPKSVLK